MKKYLIVYGSSRQDDGAFISTSRDTKKHGQEVLGTAGGGWVFAYVGRNENVEDILADEVITTLNLPIPDKPIAVILYDSKNY